MRIYRARFGLDDGTERTLEEVGSQMQLTREWVRQILERGLERLRYHGRQERRREVEAPVKDGEVLRRAVYRVYVDIRYARWQGALAELAGRHREMLQTPEGPERQSKREGLEKLHREAEELGKTTWRLNGDMKQPIGREIR